MTTLSYLEGCLTTHDSQEYVLIERSKEFPPSWLEQKPGLFKYSDEVISYFEYREVKNLNVGLQTIETDIINNMEKEFVKQIESQLMTLAKEKEPNMAMVLENNQALKSKFEKCIIDVTNSRIRGVVKIGDIYYEKYNTLYPDEESGIQSLYKYYFLLTFPKDVLPVIFTEISKNLSLSDEDGLRSLGKFLTDKQFLAKPIG